MRYVLKAEPGKFQVGDRFEISNPEKPAWCDGWFEVLAITPGGDYHCKRIEKPAK